jgi:hypothetical protein
LRPILKGFYLEINDKIRPVNERFRDMIVKIYFYLMIFCLISCGKVADKPGIISPTVSPKAVPVEDHDLVNKEVLSYDGQPILSQMLAVQQPHAMKGISKFHEGESSQLWTSQHMVEDMGSDIIKLTMLNKYLKQQHQSSTDGSLKKMAQHVLYKSILDLPYKVIFFWAHGGKTQVNFKDGMSEEEEEILYDDFYDFTSYLLKEYSGSGKTFMLGNWEGDWLLGGQDVGKEKDASDVAIEGMVRWLTIKRKAMDAALAATVHRDVRVYLYVELNQCNLPRVTGVKRVVNSVLPRVDVDFVSVSSYDIMNLYNWPTPRTAESLREKLFANLDYIEEQLKPKKGIVGKRVFIGEVGFPLVRVKSNYHIEGEALDAKQAQLTLINAALCLEWGTPFWLYWAFHNNEALPEGGYRGYGIMDQDSGKKFKVYHEFKAYYNWTKTYWKESSHPSADSFRDSAVLWLRERAAALSQLTFDSKN